MLALSMDDEIERRLEALGARTEATKTELARRKLLEALEEELRDLRDTGETSSPLDPPRGAAGEPAKAQVRVSGKRARGGTGEDLLRVLIGTVALADEAPLITGNPRHFLHIENLEVLTYEKGDSKTSRSRKRRDAR